MSVFLLLVGLTLFISGAAIYFAHAARHDPRWVWGSIFLPLIVPLYYRHHWEALRVAALIQTTGLAMTVAGTFMFFFQSVHPDSVVPVQCGEVFSTLIDDQNSGFVDSERALKLLAQNGPGHPVEGRVHDAPFRPDRVELVNGVLRLSEGEGFFPEREIAIMLGEQDVLPEGRIRRVIDPDAADAPEVHLSWIGDDGQPATKIIRHGYRLEIELVPSVRNKLSGYVQIALPDRWESYAAGDVDVVTSHLRYKADDIDRSFDHEDTLHFIAEEYLHTQYLEADVATITFSDTVLDSLEGRATTLATVTLKDGRIARHVVKAARSEFGWNVQAGESVAATEAAGYKPIYNVLPPKGRQQPTTTEQPAKAVAVPKKVLERTLSFGQLDSLTGQGAVIEYTSGRQEQGVLRGMQKDRLLFETMKGGGVVQFRIAEGELLLLRMKSGEIVHVAGAVSSISTAAPTEVAVAVTGDGVAAPVIFGGIELTRFMNKSVRLVTKDGKEKTGVLRGVNKDNKMVIEMLVGGGQVDYTVGAEQMQSIDFANH